MNRHPISTFAGLLAAFILVWPNCGAAEDLRAVQLTPPNLDGGKPLMQVLKARATSRSFSAEPLPEQVLSNLVWAAFGVNRPESRRRTAPSAQNWQEIDLYVVTPTARTHTSPRRIR